MKILLAPSESKKKGGETEFDPFSLLFSELSSFREEVLGIYNRVVKNGDTEELSALFGLKKESEVDRYRKTDPYCSYAQKAVLRYSGVVFTALDYSSLPKKAQNYIDENLIIFSNLFGPIKASDNIPDYRFSQGAQLNGMRIEKEYRYLSSDLLDAYLKNGEILDLRASWYDKYYKPRHPYTVPVFMKNDRVLSYWAKMWRGVVLREAAANDIQTINDFIAMPIEGLTLIEIRQSANRQELIYTIE